MSDSAHEQGIKLNKKNSLSDLRTDSHSNANQHKLNKKIARTRQIEKN